MCRHVLAHNGGREAAIVAHLASLPAVGGCVYLVDVDATATDAFARLDSVQPRPWLFPASFVAIGRRT